MSTLLHLDSSPLPTSVSCEVTREFAAAWNKLHPNEKVVYRDLAAPPLAVVDATWIHAAHTPEKDRVAGQKNALSLSEELIGELESANEYVIGVAMHNFSIPSTLKLWIDQVVRAGRTFSYGTEGPRGLLQGKRATVVVASGGVYTAGTAMADLDFTEPYLRTVFGFMGVTDIKFIKVGGTFALNSGKTDREEFLKQALQQVRAVAA